MYTGEDFNVTDPARIAWIFQSIKSDRQMVSVSLCDSESAMLSAILEVDRKNGYFSIDSFDGSVCHEHLLTGASFDLKCSLNGVDVAACGLSVKGVEQDSDGPVFIVGLPRQVSYRQRRNSFRARVTGLMSVPVQVVLLDPEGAKNDLDQDVTRLSNLSAEGRRLEISGQGDSVVCGIGQQLELTFQIPECDTPLHTRARLCHTRYLKRSRLWYAGCQFLDLDPEAERDINRFVVNLQALERKQEEMFSRD